MNPAPAPHLDPFTLTIIIAAVLIVGALAAWAGVAAWRARRLRAQRDEALTALGITARTPAAVATALYAAETARKGTPPKPPGWAAAATTSHPPEDDTAFGWGPKDAPAAPVNANSAPTPATLAPPVPATPDSGAAQYQVNHGGTAFLLSVDLQTGVVNVHQSDGETDAYVTTIGVMHPEDEASTVATVLAVLGRTP